MANQPTLKTERLILRPFRAADASAVQRLAGDREVASTTINIPHPYEDGLAERWLAHHRQAFVDGKQAIFAIVEKVSKALLGTISLTIDGRHRHAEMGFWIGKPYWGKGFCTEAAREMLRYGFEQQDLNRIYASHLTRNPASGRVMQKIGMNYEGCLRQHFLKWDQFEDVEMYAILKGDF